MKMNNYKFIKELDDEFKQRQSEKQEKLLREGTIAERAARLLGANILPVFQEIACELENNGHRCEVISQLEGFCPFVNLELCPRYDKDKFECASVRFSLAESGERIDAVWTHCPAANGIPRKSQKFIYFKELNEQCAIDAAEFIIRHAFRQ